MRILSIVNSLPFPLISGGRIRVYNLLRRVARRHEVFLAALLESPDDAGGIPHLQQFCARVETAGLDRRSRIAKAPGMLRFALGGKPPELRLLHSEELVTKIRQMTAAMQFDIVQIESAMGLYREVLPQNKSFKSIWMFDNVAAQQYGRISHLQRHPGVKLRAWLHGVAMGLWEPFYAGKFDRCTTVSEADRRLLVAANPRVNVDVIPNGVDVDQYHPLPTNSERALPSLMFIGNMGYQPCVDAVRYFCNDILPRIRRELPAIELWIVGDGAPAEVRALTANGVNVTGRVGDVVPYYAQCSVCIVPLRAGGGTRLKILEAMALGRPVVSTTIGCEGLEVRDGEHLLIADSPERFAERYPAPSSRSPIVPAHCARRAAIGGSDVRVGYDRRPVDGCIRRSGGRAVAKRVRSHAQC